MSDLLSRAAEAMGIPEPLAERSARARAEASGQSYEDVLAAWAGGQPAAAPSPEAAPEPATESEPSPQPPPEQLGAETPSPSAAPEPVAEEPVREEPARPTGPVPPPVLDAPPDRPFVTIGGGVVVAVAMMLLGFVFPSLPAETEEIRSSYIDLSEEAEEGRLVYQRAGCASCHTQSVRAVVADVGVGPVTLADTNQVVGYRRLGPDLANVGGRLSRAEIRAAVTGGSHPALPLSQSAVDALSAYLVESVYLQQGGEP